MVTRFIKTHVEERAFDKKHFIANYFRVQRHKIIFNRILYFLPAV